MNLLTRSPFPSLIDELFRDINQGFFIKPLHGDPLPAHIKIDVKEDKDSYIVTAELPGVNKDDIDVSIAANVLTIKATVQQEDKKTEDEKVLHSERYYGSVARSLQLPAGVDKSRATAECEKGILTLYLPKQEIATLHRLTIS